MSSNESDPFAIQPVARTRAHEEVARQLRDLMHHGALNAGDRLPAERELAQRFKVSRATIRQALSMLQNQGLVQSHVGAGTFALAAEPSVTHLAAVLHTVGAPLDDQFELRRLIEPPVARVAAERADEQDLSGLRQHIRSQERRLDEGVPFVDEDSAFHLAIAQAAKNALLVKMVEGVHEVLRESREYSLSTSDGMRQSLEGHRRLLTALERHDPLAAHEAMHAHILDVERLSLQALSEQ